jgi:hypothetical protein
MRVSTAKSIQLYKFPSLRQHNYKNKGTPHRVGRQYTATALAFGRTPTLILAGIFIILTVVLLFPKFLQEYAGI